MRVTAAAGNPFADACRTYMIFLQYISPLAGFYFKTFCQEQNAGKMRRWPGSHCRCRPPGREHGRPVPGEAAEHGAGTRLEKDILEGTVEIIKKDPGADPKNLMNSEKSPAGPLGS